jgi:hypothetical protein
MILQMKNARKTNYLLQYTDKIILSVIGSDIYCNFIPNIPKNYSVVDVTML